MFAENLQSFSNSDAIKKPFIYFLINPLSYDHLLNLQAGLIAL